MEYSMFKEARRYSNIDVCEKIAPPIPARRRASELPPNSTPQAGKSSSATTAAAQSSGIVCTNTDLLSIMNSLKSTATKALQSTKGGGPRQRGNSKTTDSLPTGVIGDVNGDDRRRDVLRSGRSNSVDVANIGAAAAMAAAAAGNSTRNWFRKMSTRTATAVSMVSGQRGADAECTEQRLATGGSVGGGEYVVQKSPVVVTFADERPKVSLLIEPSSSCKPEKHCTAPLSPPPPPPQPPSSSIDKKPAPSGCDVVVWDRPTGSVVNAEVLGTAIEGFLAAKNSSDSTDASPTADDEHHDGHPSQQQQPSGGKPVTKTSPDPSTPARTCDTSICSSLKDLFVK
ncbi:hypothetical protein QTP88_024390 [Uroleucon formosanum]